MIEITHANGNITITGHAGYAEHGKDIVCSGVSALVQTLIVAIPELTTDIIRYDIQPGWANIKHGILSERAQLLIDSFFLGLKMIADEYPQYVRLV